MSGSGSAERSREKFSMFHSQFLMLPVFVAAVSFRGGYIHYSFIIHFLSYTNLTIALFVSVEDKNSWYFFLPAVMISMAVLGGMLPRFSATISISWKGWVRSMIRYVVMGLAASFWCERTTCLFTST